MKVLAFPECFQDVAKKYGMVKDKGYNREQTPRWPDVWSGRGGELEVGKFICLFYAVEDRMWVLGTNACSDTAVEFKAETPEILKAKFVAFLLTGEIE